MDESSGGSPYDISNDLRSGTYIASQKEAGNAPISSAEAQGLLDSVNKIHKVMQRHPHVFVDAD